MTWTKGTKYEGLWKENRRCGKGTFYYVDGIVYEGEWRENKRNGRGMVLYPNGRCAVLFRGVAPVGRSVVSCLVLSCLVLSCLVVWCSMSHELTIFFLYT
jgi:hypothetical protein